MHPIPIRIQIKHCSYFWRWNLSCIRLSYQIMFRLDTVSFFSSSQKHKITVFMQQNLKENSQRSFGTHGQVVISFKTAFAVKRNSYLTLPTTWVLLFSTFNILAKSPTLDSNSRNRFQISWDFSSGNWPDDRTLSNKTRVLLSSAMQEQIP